MREGIKNKKGKGEIEIFSFFTGHCLPAGSFTPRLNASVN
jgi:hypothetical protein